jgi:DNA invertase Pin-like site-specific DNA recombinase
MKAGAWLWTATTMAGSPVPPSSPALQNLLVDVRAGKITIVVVYKVDRLTRSLADFAKLLQRF